MKKTVLAVTAILMASSATNAVAATTVMVKGSNPDVGAYLTSQGFTVVADSEDYTDVDGVVLIRNGSQTSDLASFVLGGGLLYTEWSAADWAMSMLLGGRVSGGGFVGTDTSVTFTSAGLAAGLGSGLGGSYSAGAGSEFFRTFSSLGNGEVLATRPGGIAAIVGGNAGSGYVFANGIDWQDSFSTQGAASGRVLVNALNFRGADTAVPEPTTWAMLLIGFFGIGGLLRRSRRDVKVSYNFA